MKAIAYLRCSGLGQTDGDTWDRQRAAIDRATTTLGLEIVAEYRDEGISGKTELENRPGLAATLAHIEANGVRVVIVESADRLARDMVISEVIIRQFQKLDCKVYAASGNVDLTEGNDLNPTAKLIRQILAAFAEFDRNVTVLKLKAARDRKKAKGDRCEGRKRYGFTTTERLILQRIQKLRDDNTTTDRIAEILNAEGKENEEPGGV